MEQRWLYDEFRQVGTDYAHKEEVSRYDARMSALRDPGENVSRIVGLLGLTGNEIVADIGCGTAEFSIRLAGNSALVYAVDISEEMLEFGRAKARRRGAENIRFEKGGFLTWDRSEGSLDAAVTCMALHHLPDFWKVVGLRRLWKMLRPGGRLYLSDVVYPFEADRAPAALDDWCASFRKLAPAMENNAERHIRDEYSTTSWLLEEMLKRSGFTIERYDRDGMISSYLCVKEFDQA